MTFYRTSLSVVSAFSILAMPSLAQAGTPIAFSFTLSTGASATAVPALSDALLVVLGLLLMVMAVRTLQANRGAQKLLGVLLMVGGLAVGGFGVDRTVAQNPGVNFIFGDGGLPCEDDDIVDYNGSLNDNTVTNDCATSATVTPFIRGPLECYEVGSGGTCGELSPGETCTLPPYVETCDG